MEADRLSQLTSPARAAPPLRAVLSILAGLAAGLALRLWMLHKFFEVNGDSELYGGMARNLLLHSSYALSDGSGLLHPTLIRLPGYPLFLAACFRLFGIENYFAPACVQIVIELAGCLLLALFAYRVSPPRCRMSAAQATLWLSALCPFTAIYAAQPLTEALSVFCLALVLWAGGRLFDIPGWLAALSFTFGVTFAALLRPDGALVGVAFAPFIAAHLLRDRSLQSSAQPAASLSNPRLRMVLVCLLLAVVPFAAWTVRNFRVFHVIQPLAPRYATDPGENTFPGFQRWMKTWCLDFVSTYQIYWNVPDSPIDLSLMPSRAFDSPAQFAQTEKIIAAYAANGQQLSADIDAQFAQLAADRIAANPLRYYVFLPIGRVADMWLRPRVENLPIDLDWWVYKHHHLETRFSWAYAGLNALYLVLGFAGLCLRPRLWKPMLLYMILRSILLSTIEAPEARYTIECFPLIFALGGIAIARALSRTATR